MKIYVIAPLIVIILAFLKPAFKSENRSHTVDSNHTKNFVIDTVISGDYPEESVYFDSEMNRFSYASGFGKGDTLKIYWGED